MNIKKLVLLSLIVLVLSGCLPKTGEIRTTKIDLALLVKQQDADGIDRYISPGTGCEVKAGTDIEIIFEDKTNDSRPVFQIKGVNSELKCYQYDQDELYIDHVWGSLSEPK
jgi:hypothetical protein